MGQTNDYPSDWMPQEVGDAFADWQATAVELGSNMAITGYGGWVMGDLSTQYHPPSRGPLNPPATWPI
jgi:hypothetical protein